MTFAFLCYRILERLLYAVRKNHGWHWSQEEDDILEKMDDVWYEMTDEEHEILRKEGSQTWDMMV